MNLQHLYLKSFWVCVKTGLAGRFVKCLAKSLACRRVLIINMAWVLVCVQCMIWTMTRW